MCVFSVVRWFAVVANQVDVVVAQLASFETAVANLLYFQMLLEMYLSTYCMIYIPAP